MLILGVYRYGFGNWSAIEADQELGLTGKFFLAPPSASNNNESKEDNNETTESPVKEKEKEKDDNVPKSIHLVRRTEYLLKTLCDQEQKVKRPKEGPRERPLKKARLEAAASKVSAGGTTSAVSGKMKQGTDIKYQLMMQSLSTQLKNLSQARDSTDMKYKLAAIKANVLPIGDRISELTKGKTQEEAEALEQKLWKYVQRFWPQDMEIKTIQAMYQKVNAARERLETPKKSQEDVSTEK
jgi:chromodomain-helicase-DNA-binding protein 1